MSVKKSQRHKCFLDVMHFGNSSNEINWRNRLFLLPELMEIHSEVGAIIKKGMGFQGDVWYYKMFGCNLRRFEIPGIAEQGVVDLLTLEVSLYEEHDDFTIQYVTPT